ncbi:hypothetical protein K1T71_008481 [Dendrolimus kikuchii]|uniref:Uncharacterized protein n=1 Tax=Dendrolimus kikuchii TaxID=765133 RepID=A0ACC1CYF3_9NEOP|nr:hypothetical protein K1T71_008481 [Dendrolimus kikuchii]
MASKTVLLLIAIVAASTALPTPEQDNSIFFQHVDLNARIVGGTQAATGAHPHMVALSTGGLVRSFLCGGSVISTRTVLTAAHCIDAVFSWGSLTNSLRVTVGTNRWNQGGTAYSLARNVTHPNYVSSTIKNDIGLLITSSNIVMNNLVRAIPISSAYAGNGVASIVTGWGRIVANGALSATLLELRLSTIGGDQCVREVALAAVNLNVRAPPVEPHIELCTFHSPGHGTCNGDSGSALYRADNGQQIGIVSWGFPCARGAPDMFVRVSAYTSWIQQNTV